MPMRRMLDEAAVFQPEEIDFLTKVFDATTERMKSNGKIARRGSSRTDRH